MSQNTHHKISRRTLLLGATAGLGGSLLWMHATPKQAHAMKKKLQLDPNPEVIEPFELDDLEWKARLTEEAYYVLREEGTERPFTSELNEEKREGQYACSGCQLALFESDKKYNSGTGWPSFWEAIEGRIDTKRDFKLIIPRTEYHCARCGGHQGHVFNDGPDPSGLRYCNNGVALTFLPKEEGEEEST